MKKTKVLAERISRICVIALVAVIGFVMTACGDGGDTKVKETVATPSADPTTGTYILKLSVTLTTTTEDATIYYTLDGTDPSTTSTLYNSDDKVTISETTTLKAIAVKSGMINSGVMTEVYTLPYVLTAGAWADGSITDASGEQWFKFTATAATQYIHFLPGRMSSVYVQLYQADSTTTDGTTTVGSQSTLSNSTTNINRTVTVGEEYYIKVTPYSTNRGAYRIALSESSATPAITFPTTGVITLTADVWGNGNIADTDSEQWFKFTSTATTQYIHFQTGSLSDVYVQLYTNDGKTSGNRTNLYSSSSNTSRTVTDNTEYYIRVTPYSNTGSGAYRIGFTASSTAPTITILPTTGVTTLTAGIWSDGNIPDAGGEQWFKFTSTAATQYIHFLPGALNDVYVQLYTNDGKTSGDRTNLTSYTSNTSITVTNNTEYYIKVTPYSSSYSGSYKIGFGTSSTAPAITIPTDVTTLASDTWTNGNITAAGGEQWFKFTASATNHYIHFLPGTDTSALSSAYVQLYIQTGTSVGSVGFLYSSTHSTSQTGLSNGTTYFIKVSAGGSSYSGAYKIAFNTTPATPPISPSPVPTTGVTDMTVDTWVNGNITTSYGEQWFKFTSTATTQYIHIQNGTLSGVYVQLYTSDGRFLGNNSSLNSDYTFSSYTSQPVTNATVYYIKVTNSYSTGTFKIGFTTSTTAPTP